MQSVVLQLPLKNQEEVWMAAKCIAPEPPMITNSYVVKESDWEEIVITLVVVHNLLTKVERKQIIFQERKIVPITHEASQTSQEDLLKDYNEDLEISSDLYNNSAMFMKQAHIAVRYLRNLGHEIPWEVTTNKIIQAIKNGPVSDDLAYDYARRVQQSESTEQEATLYSNQNSELYLRRITETIHEEYGFSHVHFNLMQEKFIKANDFNDSMKRFRQYLDALKPQEFATLKDHKLIAHLTQFGSAFVAIKQLIILDEYQDRIHSREIKLFETTK
jgi:hypothetical protein